jgi:hypothetical protein
MPGSLLVYRSRGAAVWKTDPQTLSEVLRERAKATTPGGAGQEPLAQDEALLPAPKGSSAPDGVVQTGRARVGYAIRGYERSPCCSQGDAGQVATRNADAHEVMLLRVRWVCVRQTAACANSDVREGVQRLPWQTGFSQLKLS